MTLIHLDGTRHRLPRPQITQANDALALVHWPAAYGLQAVTHLQEPGTPVYRVSGTRITVYCPDMYEHGDPARRQPWQPVTAPSHLVSHDALVAWLVATLTTDGVMEGRMAA